MVKKVEDEPVSFSVTNHVPTEFLEEVKEDKAKETATGLDK